MRPAVKYIRMTPHQLVANRRGHRIEVEVPRFAGHLRVKHYLEQEISELILEMRHVAALDGVGHLVRFFDGIRRDARERLDTIPRAAVGAAQAFHDRQKFAQPGHYLGARACRRRRKVSNMPAVAPQILRLP